MSSTSPQLNPDTFKPYWNSMLMEEIKKKAPSHMLAFTKWMYPDFRINWHHKVICSHLDAFVKGDITRLMIFLQPQIGKSELVSRHLPAYIFGKDPDHRILAATYGDSFSSLFNLDVQRIMESEKYHNVFPGVMLAGHGEMGNWIKNSSTFDIVNRRGRYHSVGVGGSLTGRTGNTLIIDDPVKNDEEARSQTFRDKQFNWFVTTARTRLKRTQNGLKPPKILLTMTRWHEDDLAARLLTIAKNNPNLPQWTVLKFPAICEELGNPYDPRKLDQALWPEMMSREELEEVKQSDRRTWTSLYQQRPSPESGTVLKREWWKFYKVLPADLDTQISSWDLTFKDGEKNDFVVGQVWGKKGANKYLIDQVRARMGFNEQILAFESMAGKHPSVVAKLVEDTANGPALIAALKAKITGIIAIKPKGSKLARAESVAPEVESGNIYLPDPSIAPWVHDFIEECAVFPNGTNDDQVDAFSQALNRLADKNLDSWTPGNFKKVSTWK